MKYDVCAYVNEPARLQQVIHQAVNHFLRGAGLFWYIVSAWCHESSLQIEIEDLISYRGLGL